MAARNLKEVTGKDLNKSVLMEDDDMAGLMMLAGLSRIGQQYRAGALHPGQKHPQGK